MIQVFRKDAAGNLLLPSIEPFNSKALPLGKLFRRKHGFRSESIAAGATGLISLVVPYNFVKINEIEFTNAKEDLLIDFKVYDTPTGTVSTIPNYMLNQFGFGAEMPNGLYRDTSEYDADLIKDMKIEITIKNNTSEAIILKGNITYHEVKP